MAGFSRYKMDLLDTWNMVITPVDGLFTIHKRDDYTFADDQGRAIKLPGRQWMALRIQRLH
ncbi:MAG TPA: DUF5605 domain-containing protein [Verrucomicrobiae bacterium]|nr:DUF5605 domain-containing protein [Verrucomicrobiae bacterium]